MRCEEGRAGVRVKLMREQDLIVVLQMGIFERDSILRTCSSVHLHHLKKHAVSRKGIDDTTPMINLRVACM